MPVTDIQHDLTTNTLTLTAEFDAPVDRVWDLYADPRKLERWWGPPTYPATVTRHEFKPGGRVNYYMTSPEGEKFGGFWDIAAIEEGTALEFNDGFADAEGNPVPDMPTGRIRIEFSGQGGRTRLTSVTTYSRTEDLQKVLEMGVVEGTRESMGQMDDLLAAG